MNKDALDFVLGRCSRLAQLMTANFKYLTFCSGSTVEASNTLFLSIGNLS